jgi:hypothetical protein
LKNRAESDKEVGMVDRGWAADSPRAERIALASGVVFVILAVIAFVIASGPDGGATDSEILSYFRDNDAALKWQALLFGLAGAFFLWFGGTIASVVRRAEGDRAGRLPPIIVASVAASVAIYFVGMTSWLTLAETGDGVALYHLGESAFGLSGFAAAAFVWAASLGILRTRILQEWVGYLGAALTILLLVNGVVQALGDSSTVQTLGEIAFFAFLVWVFIASSLLVSQRVPKLTPGRVGV